MLKRVLVYISRIQEHQLVQLCKEINNINNAKSFK